MSACFDNPNWTRVARNIGELAWGEPGVQFQFDEKIDLAIGKSVKATLRFYNELRKQALARGELARPPSYEAFQTMAKGLMEATKQVDLDKMKNPGMKDFFERTWTQKLLVYPTQKALRDAYETLSRRYKDSS